MTLAALVLAALLVVVELADVLAERAADGESDGGGT